MPNIFVYGTLRSPAVRTALCGNDVEAIENVFIEGFSIHPVLPHCSYPGLISADKIDSNINNKSNFKVQGTLLLNVDEKHIPILDSFESEYVHHKVTVHSTTNQISYEAFVYMWNMPLSQLDLTSTWSYEKFFTNEMVFQEFIASTKQFAESFLSNNTLIVNEVFGNNNQISLNS